MNTLLRLDLLTTFLESCQKVRTDLLNELVDNATDPVIRMRRFRMLSHLAAYEAEVIQKIHLFHGDMEDFTFSLEIATNGIFQITNRSS